MTHYKKISILATLCLAFTATTCLAGGGNGNHDSSAKKAGRKFARGLHKANKHVTETLENAVVDVSYAVVKAADDTQDFVEGVYEERRAIRKDKKQKKRAQTKLFLESAATSSGDNGSAAVILDDAFPQVTTLTVNNPKDSGLTEDQAFDSLIGDGEVNLRSHILTIGKKGDSTLFTGTLFGLGGSLIKEGAGKQTLSGVNIYTGPTIVNDGTLEGRLPTNTSLTVSKPGVYGLTGDQTIGSLDGDGQVDISNFTLTTGADNKNTTFSGIFLGNGSLTKNGAGTFTITGNSPAYEGKIIVNEGALLNSGFIPLPVTIDAGGTYQGNGYSLEVINNGTISPGNPTGVMEIDGNYTQARTAAFLANIDTSGNTNQLSTKGAASLDGVLEINFVGDIESFLGQSYTIINAASGVTGTFNKTIAPSFLKVVVSYSTTSVVLEVAKISSLVISKFGSQGDTAN